MAIGCHKLVELFLRKTRHDNGPSHMRFLSVPGFIRQSQQFFQCVRGLIGCDKDHREILKACLLQKGEKRRLF